MKYNVLTQLKAKSAPEGSYADGQGLWLVKADKARGKWVLRLFVAGRRREMGLGRWPDVSIAEAREKAAEARKVGRDQLDPIDARRKAKRRVRRLSVKEAIEGCFEARKAELKGEGVSGRWMSPLEVHVIPKIGAHAIEDVDQHLLKDLLAPIYETYSAGTGTTRFLYDGDQLTLEYDGSGNILRRYVHADGEDDPLVWYEGSGVSSPRYLYGDHQGSIVAITDASGNVTRINAYDDYGIPNAGNDVSVAGRFQYTGQAWIPELGMYHYKARVYSPTLGRFLQTDPIGYDDQVNLYAYVGNDPYNHIDATGKESIVICRSVKGIGNHCFVIIVNSKGQVTDRFSYGPEKVSCNTCDKGKLVETRGDEDSPTNKADRNAVNNKADNNSRTSLNQFGVSDEQVRKSGEGVDKKLGTTDKPGNTKYDLFNASSNTGAAWVLEGAKPGLSNKVNLGFAITPGWSAAGARSTPEPCKPEIGCRNTP